MLSHFSRLTSPSPSPSLSPHKLRNHLRFLQILTITSSELWEGAEGRTMVSQRHIQVVLSFYFFLNTIFVSCKRRGHLSQTTGQGHSLILKELLLHITYNLQHPLTPYSLSNTCKFTFKINVICIKYRHESIFLGTLADCSNFKIPWSHIAKFLSCAIWF